MFPTHRITPTASAFSGTTTVNPDSASQNRRLTLDLWEEAERDAGVSVQALAVARQRLEPAAAILDLSGLNLHTLPALTLPKNVSVLDLSNNPALTIIPEALLQEMRHATVHVNNTGLGWLALYQHSSCNPTLSWVLSAAQEADGFMPSDTALEPPTGPETLPDMSSPFSSNDAIASAWLNQGDSQLSAAPDRMTDVSARPLSPLCPAGKLCGPIEYLAETSQPISLDRAVADTHGSSSSTPAQALTVHVLTLPVLNVNSTREAVLNGILDRQKPDEPLNVFLFRNWREIAKLATVHQLHEAFLRRGHHVAKSQFLHMPYVCRALVPVELGQWIKDHTQLLANPATRKSTLQDDSLPGKPSNFVLLAALCGAGIPMTYGYLAQIRAQKKALGLPAAFTGD